MKRSVILSSTVIAAALGMMLFLRPTDTHALLPGHECNYCHSVHGAPASVLLNNAQVEALCLTCHGPGGISTLKAEVHQSEVRSSYPAFRITCRACHDPHDNRANWLGGVNIRTVGSRQDATGLAKISTPNSGIRQVVFESRGTDAGQPSLHSFADADQDGNGYYDGVCETCHTLTKFHRNDPSGGHSHNTGRTCTRCHAHTNFFLR